MSKNKSTAELSDKFKKNVLHFEVGPKEKPNSLHPKFTAEEWHAIRLNSDPAAEPHIVGYPTALGTIENSSFQAVWAPHSLNHLYSTEVLDALKEFYRVLCTNGFLFASVPNMVKIADYIVRKGLTNAIYKSKAGPVTPLDMLYGFIPMLKSGDFSCAPRTGFSPNYIGTLFKHAGFLDIAVQEEETNIWVIGYKRQEATDANQKIRYKVEDVNNMMKQRDELVKEPEIWDDNIKI